jgi:hypothetical protein
MWNRCGMPAIATLTLTAIDCPDPAVLADFYSRITGWPLDQDESDDHWVQLVGGAGATVAFQRVDSYRAPDWPGQEHPQQAHLDFEVDDLDLAEAQLLEIGARKHEFQPGHTFRVYLDPADHPF